MVTLDYIYRLVNDAWDKITSLDDDLKDALKLYDNYIANLRGDINSLKNSIGGLDDKIRARVKDLIGNITPESLDNAFEYVYDYMFTKIGDLRELIDERYFDLGSDLADLKKDVGKIADLPGELDKKLDQIQENLYSYIESKFVNLLESFLEQDVK